MNDDKKAVLEEPLTSPVQISKAPPPITPLRGFGGSFRTSSRRTADKFPNWNYWKTMDEVMIWQACALALNIDPELMTPHPQSWMAPGSDIFTEESFTSDEEADSFNKLSRRLKESLSNRQHFTPTSNRDVHLSEFAAWCVRIGMVIPQELAALTNDAQQAAPAAKVVAVPGDDDKPWLVAQPNDPPPALHWYTPARYFARKLIIEDTTLLIKKKLLGDKVATSLANVGIFRRGKIKRKFDGATILKAFSNVSF